MTYYSPKETVEGDHQYHEIEQLLVLKVIIDVLVEAKDVPWRIDITMSKLRSL